MIPYLLLDVGGTLLFPNSGVMREVILECGTDVPEACLRPRMAQYIRRVDEQLKSDGEADFRFYEWVLREAGVPSTQVPEGIRRLEQRDLENSLWNETYPWVPEALAALTTMGYRLSVISNADGRVEQELNKAGLRQYFDRVFDSHIVGFAKPDVRLFQHALAQLGLLAEQCLYVGDVYHIDVLGANRSGIAAVHLDPYSLYTGWPGCHIPNVGALSSLLTGTPPRADGGTGVDLQNVEFFPLR